MSSNSEIRNPKSAIESVSPVYFPFTFIAPSLAEALCCCFRRVVLYRPVGSSPLDSLQLQIGQGCLDVRIPFEDIVDSRTLATELNTFNSWGLLHQGADLAYLKAVGSQIAPPDPLTPRIASEIKTGAGKSLEKYEDRDLSIQLFLHLAQDFDRQSWELLEHLSRFKLQHQALQSFLRIDSEESHEEVPGERLVGMEQHPGDFLMEKRMSAWNHLFQEDPALSPVLVTDCPSALAWLADDVQDMVEVLKFKIPCPKASPDQPPWRDRLGQLFHTTLTTAWSDQLQQRIEQAAHETGQMIEAWRQSVTKPGERLVSFSWYVLQNHDPNNLLNQRCGLGTAPDSVGRVKNTLVGFVERQAG